jgi:hypothetical protein
MRTRPGRSGGIFRWMCIVLSIASLGSPRSILAAPARVESLSERRVILLVGPRHDAVFTRLRAELRSLGFRVELAKESGTVSTASDVEALARAVDAAAAILVDREDGQVGVWVAARPSGQMGLAIILPIEPDAGLVALRAVEALRSSLIDVELLVPSHEVVQSAGPERRPTVVEALPSLGGSLGPALAGSAGRMGASLHVFASAHWMPSSHWGVEALALVPLTVARWSEAEGSARLTFGFLGLGLRSRPIVARSWSIDVGGGMGAALLHAEGVPAGAGFFGSRRDTLVALPFVRIGSSVVVSSSFRLRGDVVAAAAVPAVTYTFADRARETWGRPLVIGSIGLEMVGR